MILILNRILAEARFFGNTVKEALIHPLSVSVLDKTTGAVILRTGPADAIYGDSDIPLAILRNRRIDEENDISLNGLQFGEENDISLDGLRDSGIGKGIDIPIENLRSRPADEETEEPLNELESSPDGEWVEQEPDVEKPARD